MQLINVTPVASGWVVQTEGVQGCMTFRNGGRAEAAARGLAQHLADAGLDVQLDVYLHDATLAGRSLYRGR